MVHDPPLAFSSPPEMSARKFQSRLVADRLLNEPLDGGRLVPACRPPLSTKAWCSNPDPNEPSFGIASGAGVSVVEAAFANVAGPVAAPVRAALSTSSPSFTKLTDPGSGIARPGLANGEVVS